MYSFPTQLLPAIGLISLWILAIVGDGFGGSIDRFAASLARSALLATYLVVPYTILVPLFSFFSTKQNDRKTIRPAGVTFRILAALALTLLTITLWPRPNISYKFDSVSVRAKIT